MGDPADFRNFMCAVIDEAAFDNIVGYIDFAEQSNEAEIVIGGGRDKTKGFFIEPTVVLTTNPHFKLMEEEIFGPVLTIYLYPENAYTEALELCDTTSPYALTGAVFARDRYAILEAHKKLRHAAGNFYVNDKPTGAVVGMQPFGGSRASGTNDKAGSMLNLLRWATPRTIKETFVPQRTFSYPFMDET
jgi:1-pyrroline-5-carboxylate dehydrogenase